MSIPRPTDKNSNFLSQRDALVNRIAVTMDSLLYNLDTLNMMLNESVQVGKEFEEVQTLWKTFYDTQQFEKNLGLTEQDNKKKARFS